MTNNSDYKGTLLVVDDLPENIKVLLEFLSRANFRILMAQNGSQGIEMAQSGLPDLILLDIMMPDMSGFEVCQVLKSQPLTQDIPIIFITALTDTTNKIKGFKLGGADYITKPFQQEEVVARVSTHINLYRLQRQLKEHAQELKKSNQELDAFAHTVAHDLKNPLGGVIGISEVMMQTCFADSSSPIAKKCQENLSIVLHAGYQMNSIIESILLLAGVSRQQKITIQVLEMSEIFQQVLQDLKPMLTDYQAEVQYPQQWPQVKGYAPWIREIWTNYLSNALKYGGKPPRLEVGATVLEDEKMVQFWVDDDGPGLSGEDQSSLFIPFTRLHTNRAKGHGLGLSIVQKIVEKLGGQVGVKSTLGQGSRFYFTLPMA
jgi:signal transduction histidine kinase